jgi:tryptophan-rich sensory protein
MSLILGPLFLVAYLAGVFGLIWFNLHVLDLGDPKFRTDVGLYFSIWSALFSPVAIAAVVFLARSEQEGWRLLRSAGLYLVLIVTALEISLSFDLDLVALIPMFIILSLLFWKIQQTSDRYEIRGT